MDYKQLYNQTPPTKPKTSTALIRGIDTGLWKAFQGYCRFEGTTATQKLKDLISEYVESQGKEK